MVMKYQNPVPTTKSEIGRVVSSGDESAIAEICVNIAYFEDDWEWALGWLRDMAIDHNRSVSLRCVAATCIGHLARINKATDAEMAKNILLVLSADNSIKAAVSDALDDLHIFRTA